jgi:hypothetical protein
VPPENESPHAVIMAWGNPQYGGTAPSGSGYTKIYSTERAFAALKADGSITAWGVPHYGGTLGIATTRGGTCASRK